MLILGKKIDIDYKNIQKIKMSSEIFLKIIYKLCDF